MPKKWDKKIVSTIFKIFHESHNSQNRKLLNRKKLIWPQQKKSCFQFPHDPKITHEGGSKIFCF